MILRINRSDADERVEITLEGRLVASLSHDEHGWAGISAATGVAERLAKAAGWPVEHTYDDDDEPDDWPDDEEDDT